MKRWLFTVLLALLSVAGCVEQSFFYKYRGTLLKPDGTPAQGVKVSVQPSDRHLYFYTQDGDTRPSIDLLQDIWTTTTDQFGQFSGMVNSDSTYTPWFILPVPPAPKLPGMYVWVFTQSEWVPIFVPLHDAAQQRGYPSGRYVDLPAVTLRYPTTRPASAPS